MKALFTFCLCSLFLNVTPAFAQPSLLKALQKYRGEYPTPMSKAQTGELLTRTAQSAPGWVLLLKPQGNNCPAMGVRVSCDYLVYAPTGQGYDVLQDSEGKATPRWNKGDSFKADRFVAVGSVVVVIPPVVPPSLPPVVPDGGGNVTIASHLITIEQALVRVLALLETQQKQIAAITARPLPTYTGSVLGMSVTLRPE